MGVRQLVIVGVVGVGALTAGTAAAAIGDGSDEPVIVETATTTTLEGTTTTLEEETTTTTSSTTAETTTTVEPPTTVLQPAPEPTEDAEHQRGPDPFGPAKHGLCRAFSGRSGQPGNSQAYANLFEAAGGDIEAFCADVLSSQSSDEDDDAPDDDAAEGRPEHPGKGHGRGKGHGKGAKGKGHAGG